MHLGFVCLCNSVGSGAEFSGDGNRRLWDQVGQLGSGALADRGSEKIQKLLYLYLEFLAHFVPNRGHRNISVDTVAVLLVTECM